MNSFGEFLWTDVVYLKHFRGEQQQKFVCQIQCDQIWRNFAILAKFWRTVAFAKGLCSIWQNYYLLWQIYCAIGPIFIVANGQISKSNLVVQVTLMPIRHSPWQQFFDLLHKLIGHNQCYQLGYLKTTGWRFCLQEQSRKLETAWAILSNVT